MILTTTNTIEGFKIIEYKGIVTGTSFEMKTKFSFKVEKSKDITKAVINEAKEHAFQELQNNAKNLKINHLNCVIQKKPVRKKSSFDVKC